MNRDKNLSGILIFLTLGFILFIAGSDGGIINEDSMTLKESIQNIFEYYFDFVIIFYFFLCLQIAGYLELKYRQDFLTVSITGKAWRAHDGQEIMFTPLDLKPKDFNISYPALISSIGHSG